MKIAAVDLDGTMMRSDSRLSDYTKKVIEEAAEHDIIVIPTSGRSHRSIMEKIEGVRGINYTISSNGTVVTEIGTENIIYEKKFRKETIYAIYRHIIEGGGFIEVYCGNESYVEKGNGDVLRESQVPLPLGEDLLYTDIRILSMDQLIRSGTMAVNKVFFTFREPEQTRACVEWLAGFDDIVYGYSTSYYTVEIFPKGANKDIALDFLRTRLGVQREDVIAMGDSENDLALIRYAHMGVAVENGMDILKENADYICESNDEDGPARLLEKVIQKKFEI